MKRILALFAITVSLLIPHMAAAEQTVTLDVQNMTCAVCPITVRKSLEAVDGVDDDVQVSFKTKTAVVTFDETITDVAALTSATTNAGYPSVSARSPLPNE